MANRKKDREERLAAALRENLKRRKAQARAMIRPETGRGTAARSGVVKGAPSQAKNPLHHPPDGPPPRSGED
ncbi:MAG TPA: hypothetical protein VFK86_12260 [Bauldia sp.]|nr:hypothetical protein [Bauldia sp.]